MVEQDAAAAEDVIGLAVIDGHPVRVKLGHTIGAARVERRALALRDFLHLAEHFGRGCLVEANLRIDDADRFQQVERAQAGDLRSGGRLVERDTDEALRRVVVDFGRAGRLQQADAGPEVGQVILDQGKVRVLVDAKLLDAPEVDGAGPAIGADDLVAFAEKQFGEIGAILSGNAGNDCGRCCIHVVNCINFKSSDCRHPSHCGEQKILEPAAVRLGGNQY